MSDVMHVQDRERPDLTVCGEPFRQHASDDLWHLVSVPVCAGCQRVLNDEAAGREPERPGFTLGCNICHGPFRGGVLAAGDDCPWCGGGPLVELDPEVGRALDAHQGEILSAASRMFFGGLES